jgi:uncharacterized protein YndB with AHSA1/START domain
MASWRQQALVEAPVEEVWALIVDWNRYPDWNSDVIKVTGAPASMREGSMFELRSRGPLGLKGTTPFKVEQIEDMREMKVKCQVSGYYAHWLLTEARGNTFAEIELGVEPMKSLQGRATGALHTKGYLRRSVEQMIDNLRYALSHQRSAAK